jgi:uncharacterized cupin superfamily protein
MVDTPTHVHDREDELWYVLEGEHVFQVGDESIESALAALSSRHEASHTLNAVSSQA